jgi:hypothetical protein
MGAILVGMTIEDGAAERLKALASRKISDDPVSVHYVSVGLAHV